MDNINVSKYVYFDVEYGKFFLTANAQEIIYREKEIINSYSGSNEWCHNFMCELIDLYSGASQYNYALGSVVHIESIKKYWEENKEGVISFIGKLVTENWGIKLCKMMDNLIDDLPSN